MLKQLRNLYVPKYPHIDNRFYFVDLPGYGYSKMSKKEQEQVRNVY